MKLRRAEEMSLPELAAWFFYPATRFPELFQSGDLGFLWWKCEEIAGGDRTKLVTLLRTALLKRLYQRAQECERCPLHANRLNGLPVLDDSDYGADLLSDLGTRVPIGAVNAEIFVIGEGPGALEARTGQPFVGWATLMGSRCARACGSWETCFPVGTKNQQVLCEPRPLAPLLRKRGEENGRSKDSGWSIQDELIQLQGERVSVKPWKLHTAGQVLDQVLNAADLWRQSWNGYGTLKGRETREPGIYLANLVKCRSCRPNPKKYPDQLEDETPSPELIEACRPFLEAQLYILQPRVIVCLGIPATQAILGIEKCVMKDTRGRIYRGPRDLPVLPDYHPSYALRKLDPNRPGEVTQAYREVVQWLVDTFEQAKQLQSGAILLPWESQGVSMPRPDGDLDPRNMLEVPTFPEEVAQQLSIYALGEVGEAPQLDGMSEDSENEEQEEE